MNQRSIEIRVGALILVAVALIALFTVLMAGITFQPTYTVYVSFQNPGGLTTGAPVRISGVKVGRVSEIEFLGALDRKPPAGQSDALIRVTAKIETRYANSIHDNSRWFVTVQGVLGEMFLAVEPGSPERPVLRDGAQVHGVSPPQLDLLLSESYELLHRAYRGLSDNEQKISETFDGLHRTLGLTGGVIERNQDKIDHIIANADTLSTTAADTLKAARERYVDGPQVTRILNNVEHGSEIMAHDVGPLVSDSREVLSDTKKITHVLASDEQLAALGSMTRDLGDAAKSAKSMAGDAQALLDRVKQGKGTAGALVRDEALYDDLSELVRDLKHNPWKLLWKQ
ncbi:MAG TPA: MlaD family protein [Polyangiaceae bacterium]|nr:MlaD family protein [Polyangiaceae bacterium]